MAKVKLELKKKNDDELLTFCDNHIKKMENNASFPNPLPSVPDYLTGFTAYSDKFGAFRALEDAIAQARIEKDEARAELERLTTGRGNYVETGSAGDAAKILSAGFEVKGAGAPVGELPAPINFLAKMGTMPGQIILTWKKVYGAGSYEVECREHDAAGTAWERVKTVTPAKLKVENLTPGKNYAFRVRAIGAAGEGPWSDETVKMAP
jgi:hypothetical protein